MAVPAWDGYPPNPEKDGWHWIALPTTDIISEHPGIVENSELLMFLTRVVMPWSATRQVWLIPDGVYATPAEVAHRDENGDGLYYYSPCYSKDDLNNV